jgi:hypothetical protein
MSDDITRRDMIKRSLVVLGAASAAGAVLMGCGDDEGELTCTDTSGLSEPEKQMREQQAYTDHSPERDKLCDNCRFWTAPQQPNTCGGCQVIKGPIHPKGYCKLWAAMG